MAHSYKIPQLKNIHNKIEMSKEMVLQDILDEGKEKFKEYVEQYWYGSYSPQDYDRTEQVLNCISAKLEGDTVTLYYDESKISPHDAVGWGQHIGFNGESFDIEFIEEGVGGGVATNPRRGTGGANAIRRTRGWLANYITKAVQKRFGISVKVR